jgi:NAD(P)-dependent dehydrogenase (short-subunit alcohol dehydrogenase family)
MHTSDIGQHLSKNILILGASSDIGLALGNWLKGKDGYKVMLAARNKDRATAIPFDPDWKLLQDVDLLQGEHLDRLRTAADSFFQSPFSIIHCVGDFWCHAPLVDLTMAQIRQMMDSHYLTLCGVANVLLPLLMERRGGRLLAFSCNSVVFNYPDMVPFTSAKAAVECAIKCIAHEYAPYGIAALALALRQSGLKRCRL